MDDTSLLSISPHLPLTSTLIYQLSSLANTPVLAPKPTNPNAFVQTKKISENTWHIQVDAEDGIATKIHIVQINQWKKSEIGYKVIVDGEQTEDRIKRVPFTMNVVRLNIEAFDSDACLELKSEEGIRIEENKQSCLTVSIQSNPWPTTITSKLKSADMTIEAEIIMTIIQEQPPSLVWTLPISIAQTVCKCCATPVYTTEYCDLCTAYLQSLTLSKIDLPTSPPVQTSLPSASLTTFQLPSYRCMFCDSTVQTSEHFKECAPQQIQCSRCGEYKPTTALVDDASGIRCAGLICTVQCNRCELQVPSIEVALHQALCGTQSPAMIEEAKVPELFKDIKVDNFKINAVHDSLKRLQETRVATMGAASSKINFEYWYDAIKTAPMAERCSELFNWILGHNDLEEEKQTTTEEREASDLADEFQGLVLYLGVSKKSDIEQLKAIQQEYQSLKSSGDPKAAEVEQLHQWRATQLRKEGIQTSERDLAVVTSHWKVLIIACGYRLGTVPKEHATRFILTFALILDNNNAKTAFEHAKFLVSTCPCNRMFKMLLYLVAELYVEGKAALPLPADSGQIGSIIRSYDQVIWKEMLLPSETQSTLRHPLWLLSRVSSATTLSAQQMSHLAYGQLFMTRYRSRNASNICDTTGIVLYNIKICLMEMLRSRNTQLSSWMETRQPLFLRMLTAVESWSSVASGIRYIENHFINQKTILETLRYVLRWQCILFPADLHSVYVVARIEFAHGIPDLHISQSDLVTAQSALEFILAEGSNSAEWTKSQPWFSDMIIAITPVTEAPPSKPIEKVTKKSTPTTTKSVPTKAAAKVIPPIRTAVNKEAPTKLPSAQSPVKLITPKLPAPKAGAKSVVSSVAKDKIAGTPVLKPLTKVVAKAAAKTAPTAKPKMAAWDTLIEPNNKGSPIDTYDVLILLAKVLQERRLEELNPRIEELYRMCIECAPTKIDSYIDLATLQLESGHITQSIDTFTSFPFPSVDLLVPGVTLRRPGEAEIFVHTEINRLMLKDQMLSDFRFARSLIWEGRGNGIQSISKYIDALDGANLGKICMQIYAGINGRKMSDPEMQAYFKNRYWI